MPDDLPHESAFTRLGPSGIAGVGVFAIRDIPIGTNIFPNDRLGIRWIDRSVIDRIEEPGAVKLYAEFAIRSDGRYGCPQNFNSMTVGWYLNEPAGSDMANVTVDPSYSFYAARDIRTGRS